jgi:hypothetical protein
LQKKMVTRNEFKLTLAAACARNAMLNGRASTTGKVTDVEIVVRTLAAAKKDLRLANLHIEMTGAQAAKRLDHGDLPRFDIAIPCSLGGRFAELGRRVDCSTSADDERVSELRSALAKAVIEIFGQLGTPSAKVKFDLEKDERALDLAAEQFSRSGVYSERQIGREIGLSRTQVGKRIDARCLRIMGRLRIKFPTEFRQHQRSGIKQDSNRHEVHAGA